MSEERQSWNSVANAWERHWKLFEPATIELNRRLVDRARVEPGHVVLDVATGQGEPAFSLARRVGPSGRVVATDFSTEMLAGASRRAATEGLTGIEFLERDAQALELEPDSFDAATCRWGLMLVPNIRAALGGILHGLRPGAWLAAAVWGPVDEAPLLTLPREVLMRELGVPGLPEPGLEAPPNPLRLGNPGMLDQLLREEGYAEVASEAVEVHFRFSSADDYVTMIRDMSSSLRQAVAELTADDQARIWQQLRAAVERYRTSDGTIVLPNTTQCVWGRCPLGPGAQSGPAR